MWYRSPDGQTLLLSSRDGYCTIVIFDEILPASHTQQHALQLQSIAHQNSVPLVSSSAANTPATSTIGLPHLHTHSITPSSGASKKRSEPPLTPAASTDGESGSAGASNSYFNPGGGAVSMPSTTTTALATASASTSISMPVGGNSDNTISKERESQKRQAPGTSNADDTNADNINNMEQEQEPPKKKRRVALTRVGDLDS